MACHGCLENCLWIRFLRQKQLPRSSDSLFGSFCKALVFIHFFLCLKIEAILSDVFVFATSSLQPQQTLLMKKRVSKRHFCWEKHSIHFGSRFDRIAKFVTARDKVSFRLRRCSQLFFELTPTCSERFWFCCKIHQLFLKLFISWIEPFWWKWKSCCTSEDF